MSEVNAATEPELLVVEPVTTAAIRDVVAMSAIRDFFDNSFSTIAGVLAAQSVAPTGAAFGLYHQPPGDILDIEVGFPTDRAVQPEGPVFVGTLPGGRVARTIHVGGFDGLGSSWERLRDWIQRQGLTPGPVMWEVYLVEPAPDMDPSALRTELNWTLADQS
ncbi:GyrI-like domain-containing protein [Saccharopolyspora erythraea]|uniref:GyrI-like domain-containing protein n=1 Tax=Saccharopolyspora erythraea TaxID=1836 RepID=UPI001BA95A59|nr:GyrI-like domain-containing protein [Saccharopolyspora erythraea]QUH02911.1 GyrI-like domain-containing protein [Saccharopolyspora erythraea]